MDHARFIRRSIELAGQAQARGDHPFGALLVDYDGDRGATVVLEALNSVSTDSDCTRHAELNLISEASRRKVAGGDGRLLTLYTSTEPCCMCCGAIYWSGLVGRVVFACSEQRLGYITDESKDAITRSIGMDVPCRETFAKTREPKIEVVGPVLEEEAAAMHAKFW